MKKTKKLIISGEKDRVWDATFQLMSWWDAESVRKSSVMVVGAGALGNEVLKNLALMNIGHILTVDFDTVEYANLSRSVLFRESDSDARRNKCEVAAERIRQLNPNVRVMALHGDIMIDIGLGVFRRMDAIIGCLDNRLARLMINRQAFRIGKSWIDGAIENLSGQMVVYKPGTSCYECQLSDSEWANIRERMGCPDVARRNYAAGKIPTTPISASIIGALQVQEALKLIHHNDKQSTAGEIFRLDGMHNLFMHYDVQALKKECDSHFQIAEVIELPELRHTSTVQEALDILCRHFDDEGLWINLDHEFVIEVTGEDTGHKIYPMKAKPHLSDDILDLQRIDPLEELFITKSVSVLDRSFPYPELTLKDIGIPPLHIVSVETKGDIHFAELNGDKDFMKFT